MTTKVYIRCGKHAFFEDLIKYPPKGVAYDVSKRHDVFEPLKKILWKQYVKFKPPAVYINPPEDTDLIYSTGGIMVLDNMPWVTNIESATAFVAHQYNKLNSKGYMKGVENILKSNNCKKIMCDVVTAKKSALNFIPEVKSKLEVVYPAIYPIKFKKIKSEKTRILLIGKNFYGKGGFLALKIFDDIKENYDTELTMITNASREFREKYKDVNFVKYPVPREKLFSEYYPNSDIFLFPSRFDTFGFVLLEAMVFELPIVASKQFGTPEIVKNGKNGFLIKPSRNQKTRDDFEKLGLSPQFSHMDQEMKKIEKESLKNFVEKISLLIENESLRNKMGKNGRKEVEKGKFSIKERNKKLKRIYKESIG